MSTPATLWAKSASHGGALSLHDHTRQVMDVAAAIAKATHADERLALAGAALHDLGKAHPAFQRKLEAKPSRKIDDPNQILHRHELSSLGFLPLWPRADWPVLVDMVVAHHKPMHQPNDLLGKGILDLDDRSRTWLADHLAGWDDWAPSALAVLGELGLATRPIGRAEAEDIEGR